MNKKSCRKILNHIYTNGMGMADKTDNNTTNKEKERN